LSSGRYIKEATIKNSLKFKVSSPPFHGNRKGFRLFGSKMVYGRKMVYLETLLCNEKYYLWVSLYGNLDKIEYYYYKIKITGKERQKITFQDNVRNGEEDLGDIPEKKDTMMITEDDFNRLAIDGELDCEVTLKSSR
jgi:hypothetical protein